MNAIIIIFLIVVGKWLNESLEVVIRNQHEIADKLDKLQADIDELKSKKSSKAKSSKCIDLEKSNE